MCKKLCIFILVAIALAPIFILQAQTSTTNFSLYVGQEGKIKTINLSNYYEVTSIEFKSDDPNYSQYLNLEIREINSERDIKLWFLVKKPAFCNLGIELKMRNILYIFHRQ